MQKIFRTILVLFFCGTLVPAYAIDGTGELCQYCESDADCPDSYCDGECCVDSSEEIVCDPCVACPDGYSGCWMIVRILILVSVIHFVLCWIVKKQVRRGQNMIQVI